ncbi:DUF397 domain-containing protein [Pseudonocardiaceae bacterium YIM PH 21723]|nr:DUF397 domain-containing protein [Pseudonocardiaceae bacterium YIM PH 21723]
MNNPHCRSSKPREEYNPVEAALKGAKFRKARRSENAGACVETAEQNGVRGFRDSKDPLQRVVAVGGAQGLQFFAAVDSGRLKKSKQADQ